MNIKIKYFGEAAEIVGKEEESLNLDRSLTISQLLRELTDNYPSLKSKTISVAFNGEIVDEDFEFKSDGEVAILPPFAGG